MTDPKKTSEQKEEDLELAGYTSDIHPPPPKSRRSRPVSCDEESRWGEEARYEQVVNKEAARSRPANKLP